MHALIEELLAAGPVVTDGAWGTQMQARGLGAGDCPDAWNLDYPERVEEVARAYVEAGSQIILTNTFRASRFGLAKYGLAEKAAQINRAGAEISRRAAAGRARVFGSIGPSGVMLMMGQTSEEELRQAFGEQALALAEGGADAIVVETMADPAEAKLAVAAARDVVETMADPAEAKLAVAAARVTGLPVVASMTFDSGKDRDRTMMGTTPEQVAELLTDARADVIGSNCGQGIEGYVAICKRLKAATDRPIWIKANAGLPEVVDGQTVWKQTAEEFASYIPALVQAGASFLGGCCGTSPEFIRAIKEKLSR